MLTALTTRFEDIKELRRDRGLLFAQASREGQPVLLCHSQTATKPSEGAQAGRTVLDRLRAADDDHCNVHELLEHEFGLTWVCAGDDGQFLDEWLASNNNISLHASLCILLDLAQALELLHRSRVLHLHLRPTCIRVEGDVRPRAKLLPIKAVPVEAAAWARHDADFDDLRFSAPELSGRGAIVPDARSDLYLFGLIAYHVLTGQQPFDAQDALSWVHAHLAQAPKPLRDLLPEIPAPIERLVMSLLIKSADHRPASARLLVEDLQQCLHALNGGDTFDGAVTLRSLCGRFTLPRRLIRREQEQDVLNRAVERIRNGAVEMLLVHGVSGVGKTALLRDLKLRIEVDMCLFAGGKFEQLGSERPYAVLGKMLDDIVRAESLHSEHMPAMDWVKQLGATGAALAVLSQEIARLAGPFPALAEISTDQARQRLLVSLLALLTAVSQRWKGVVLFLDDVQWADDETMALLASVLADRELRGILLVLGRRTEPGEIEPVLPNTWTFDPAMRSNRMLVPPMGAEEVLNWLEAALPGGVNPSDEVVERLLLHSTGNPFFLGQLVSTLVQQGRLAPDQGGRWCLDSSVAQGIDLPHSAVATATQRMKALSPKILEVLGLAAALGAQFTLDILAQIAKHAPEIVRDALLHAQAAGLVEESGDKGHWQFVHDRLQLAAYEVLDASTRLQRHAHIGRTLRDGSQAEQLRFEICHHLNRVVHLLTDSEREALALLNQRAAVDARGNTAFAQCAALMRAALAALRAQNTLKPRQYLALLHDAADAAIMERDFKNAEDYLSRAKRITISTLEQARNDELKIHLLIAQERSQEALELGEQGLRRLGLPVSLKHAQRNTLWQFICFKFDLRKTPLDALLAMPASNDPLHLQTQRLIFATINVAHVLASPLYAVLGLLGTRQAMRHGITPWSWLPISVAGHMLAGVFGDIDTGYHLGELSMRLGRRFGTHSISYNHLFYTMHWKVPVTLTLPLLWSCYEQAERSGNFELASYGVCMHAGVVWNAMGSLPALADANAAMDDFALRRGKDLARDCCTMLTWVHDTLVRKPPIGLVEPLIIQRAEGRVLPHDEQFQMIFDQLAVMLNVVYGQFGEEVVAWGRRIHRNLHRMVGNFSTPLLHWFEAQLHAQRLLLGMPDRKSRSLINGHLAKLRKWTAHCPANHAHRVLSLEALNAALDDDATLARQRFEQAIAHALHNGFIGDAAIIAESGARCLQRKGDDEAWRAMLEQSYALYEKWGATGKLRQMEAALPQLAPAYSDRAATLALDTQTLIKASQAIGTELEQSRVAEHLLQQAMENVGARYGALLLENQGGLLLSAERAEVGVAVEQSLGQPIEQTGLPLDIVRLVRMARDSVVLDDAPGQNEYGQSRRWRGREAVSVLCVPVLTAGDCVGVLYLENDLMRGCFTPERVGLVGVLASQAAIAISNSRLFAEIDAARVDLEQSNLMLEQRVAERTQELKENYQQLARLERQHATDEERQRIMRDLHDGLGSQLFVTLSRVERGEIGNDRVVLALRECIADMRLALEAMSPDGNDFLEVWGNFRYRWEALLDAENIVSQWNTDAPTEGFDLPPPISLQLLRIVQEALTNVLKHAQARYLSVNLAAREGWLRIDITDDGIGLAVARPGGRGLGNMHTRASRIGAQLEISATLPGTRVFITYELKSA